MKLFGGVKGEVHHVEEVKSTIEAGMALHRQIFARSSTLRA
jgi:hypothetical protein